MTNEISDVESVAVNQPERHPSKLDTEYANLIRIPESRKPRPQDGIPILLKPEQQEYAVLKEAGIGEERLAEGVITRQELLDAGFFFHNRLGGGEKGIISGTIPDPEDTTRTLDFTDRVLLTRKELEAIYAYQQAHADQYGINQDDLQHLDEIRQDMLSFMIAATSKSTFYDGRDFVNSTLPYQPIDFRGYIKELTYGKDRKLIVDFWTTKIKAYMKEQGQVDPYIAAYEVRKQFAIEHCADLYAWQEESDELAYNQKNVRGHTVRSIKEREKELYRTPSPFLESGFVFGKNIDVNIFLSNPIAGQENVQRRLNIGNLHIMGGHPDFPGLSEMGEFFNDQSYLTFGEYVRELLPQDSEERREMQAREAVQLGDLSSTKIRLLVDKRVREAAREWNLQLGRLEKVRIIMSRSQGIPQPPRSSQPDPGPGSFLLRPTPPSKSHRFRVPWKSY
jgi:hypothetical protein